MAVTCKIKMKVEG